MEKDETVSRTKRRAAIHARIQALQKTAPADFNTWTFGQTMEFNLDCLEQRKHAERGNFERFLAASERVARAYGVTMAEIDPGVV